MKIRGLLSLMSSQIKAKIRKIGKNCEKRDV